MNASKSSSFCQQNREARHFCYMHPLKNELSRSDNVLFAFYNFETTQDTRLTVSTTVHNPNLVCLQHFCALCEKEPEIDMEFVRCGIRRHSSRSLITDTCCKYIVRMTSPLDVRRVRYFVAISLRSETLMFF